MRIIRTVIWVVIAVAVLGFIAMNLNSVAVNCWPLSSGYLHFDWPVGFVALFFFLLGLLPMWLLSKAGHWRLRRRIAALENSVRAVTPSAPHETKDPETTGH